MQEAKVDEMIEIKVTCPICDTKFKVFSIDDEIECFTCGFNKFYIDEELDGSYFIDVKIKDIKEYQEKNKFI